MSKRVVFEIVQWGEWGKGLNIRNQDGSKRYAIGGIHGGATPEVICSFGVDVNELIRRIKTCQY